VKENRFVKRKLFNSENTSAKFGKENYAKKEFKVMRKNARFIQEAAEISQSSKHKITTVTSNNQPSTSKDQEKSVFQTSLQENEENTELAELSIEDLKSILKISALQQSASNIDEILSFLQDEQDNEMNSFHNGNEY
jgi:enolase